MPGDDIRRVDWKVYARTDRYYVKEFEADTNTNFSDPARRLEVDELRQPRSRSSEYASYAGGLPRPISPASSATASGSSPSTTTSSTHVPPSAKHLDVVLHTLDRASGRAAAKALSAALDKLAEHFKRRGIVVLISDLYEEPTRSSTRSPSSGSAATT